MLFHCIMLLFVLTDASSLVVDANPPNGGEGRTTSFLSGDFGVVLQHENGFTPSFPWDSKKVKKAAAAALHNVLVENVGYTGNETILPTNDTVGVDRQRNVHVRCQQYASGLEIEGASMVIHINGSDGTIFAANGEFHSSDSIEIPPEEESLDCELAIEIALMELGITNGEWISECEAAAVQGRDGTAYLAYKRLLGYDQTEGGATSLYHKDLLFASRTTGSLLAVHPKIYGARSLRTYDALNQYVKSNERYLLYNMSALISNSSERINTTDSAVNDAHNHAIAVYDFYMNVLGRDSIDGKGMTLESFVHFDKNLVNAFWDGSRMVYGDGDGVTFTYFAKGLDVVAHELSHGVTQYTSDLVYEGLCGALNEAFSDIMGAAVERLYGNNKSISDVWTIAEDCDLDPSDGIGLRNMADPPMFHQPDYFADRDMGFFDNGGVHTNSGIVNKAFYLMVEGGIHSKSGVVVPALDPDFDNSIRAGATIFYEANSMCFTKSSDFHSARACTLIFAEGPNQTESISRAWDAVGVVPVEFLPMANTVMVANFSLSMNEERYFVMNETIEPGYSVTCSISGKGDPDLFVKLGSPPIVSVVSFNDCVSRGTGTGAEICTTGPANHDTEVYVTVFAYRTAREVNLVCFINDPVPTVMPTARPSTTRPSSIKPTSEPCKQTNEPCSTTKNCCGRGRLTCRDGLTSRTKTCKICKKSRRRCNRSIECCGQLKCRANICR